MFIPCLTDLSRPQTGLNMADLLEHAGLRLTYPDGQTCCGQPAYNTGYPDEALPFARHFIELFDREEYIAVVAPSGSCVSMVRVHYSELDLSPSEKLRWNRLKGKVYEFTEFFARFAPPKRFSFKNRARVVYHDPCHLMRELGVTEQPRTLLERVEMTEIVESPEEKRCCGFGGTFSVKYPELSSRMADLWIDELLRSEPDTIVSADLSCLLQIEGRLKERGVATPCEHIIDYLHRSWNRE